MRSCFLFFFITCSTSLAFSQPIHLAPGSSIVINGDVVSCEGPSEESLPPVCSIRQSGGQYKLFVGDVLAETFYNFQAALEGAKQMKAAQLCR